MSFAMTFDEYRKLVDKYTSAIRHTIPLEEGDELDHRLQVKLCWLMNIHPKVVANKINLRALPKEFNASRQAIPDEESVAALHDLIAAKLLDDTYLPSQIVEQNFLDLPQVKNALITLSLDKPHAQVYVPVGVLARIDPIENQRKHEARYPMQLDHFVDVGVRPKHIKFIVTVWQENGEWQVRVTDGNTRKHNILNYYLHLLGIKFPDEVTVDIEFCESHEQALKDSLLHDAMGAGKTHVDITNGFRRELGLNSGILIKKIDDGTSLNNIIYTVALNSNFAMRTKTDITAGPRALNEYYMDVLYVVNRFVALGKPMIRKPNNINDWHIAAAVMMWKKYGEDAAESISEMFEYIRMGYDVGFRNYGVFSNVQQPLGVIHDELHKFNYRDITQISSLKQKTTTGKLPRRIMDNSNNDGNVGIYVGLLLHAMTCSMNNKQINEDLYLEFLSDVTTYSDSEEDTLRARSALVVENYFNAFWTE